MIAALVFVAVLLLVGVVLRQRLSLFRWLFIPASVIAGLCGLIVIQLSQRGGHSTFSDWASDSSKILSSWPGFLIAVVFAGMLMERSDNKPDSLRARAKRVGKQGLMVWIIVLGETGIGLLATWMVIQSFQNVPNSFGMLIETGFAGGHGTASAMGQVFRHPTIDLPSGQDLGTLMATCGLVYGVVSGIVWINLGARMGWIRRTLEKASQDQPDTKGQSSTDESTNTGETTNTEPTRTPIGYQRISRDTIDPLLLQMVWLALAVGLGMAMQFAVMQLANWLDQRWFLSESADAASKQLANRLTVSNVVDFPLFIYTLFGGLAVRLLLVHSGHGDKLDSQSINRLTSSAMEILVVAAIASLNITAVVTYLGSFSVLFVAGAIWTAICLLLISRWILPKDCWFQLGLINYGMSTGTTATGFVLLRMVDPEFKTTAAEDYALAAPLSAPFIGGGILTVALPLLLLQRVHIAWPALAIAGIVAAMIVVGKRWNREGK